MYPKFNAGSANIEASDVYVRINYNWYMYRQCPWNHGIDGYWHLTMINCQLPVKLSHGYKQFQLHSKYSLTVALLSSAWWRHQMKTFSALLAFCAENSPHKGQWRGALMFSLIWTWINSWVNNPEAGDLRRHRAHCYVSVMSTQRLWPNLLSRYIIHAVSVETNQSGRSPKEVTPFLLQTLVAISYDFFNCMIQSKWDQIIQESTIIIII